MQFFGLDHQMVKSMEEFSELQTELARSLNSAEFTRNLRLEIVDAQIMLDQLKMFFFTSADEDKEHDYDAMRAAQLTRLKATIQRERAGRDASDALYKAIVESTA